MHDLVPPSEPASPAQPHAEVAPPAAPCHQDPSHWNIWYGVPRTWPPVASPDMCLLFSKYFHQSGITTRLTDNLRECYGSYFNQTRWLTHVFKGLNIIRSFILISLWYIIHSWTEVLIEAKPFKEKRREDEKKCKDKRLKKKGRKMCGL